MNKILIVGDEKAVSIQVKVKLEERGYSCMCEYDGEIAADLIENTRYDLILLDVMIPKINGYELLKYIKQIDEEIPIIFITAKTQVKDKIKALKERSRRLYNKAF